MPFAVADHMRDDITVLLAPVVTFVWSLAWLTFLWVAAAALAGQLARVPGLALLVAKRGLLAGIARTFRRASVRREGRRGWASRVSKMLALIPPAGALLALFVVGSWLGIFLPFHAWTARATTGLSPIAVLAAVGYIVFRLVRSALVHAGTEALAASPLRSHAYSPGRRAFKGSMSAPSVEINLRWPAHLVHVLDRRAIAARTHVAQSYALTFLCAVVLAWVAYAKAKSTFLPRTSNWASGLAILETVILSLVTVLVLDTGYVPIKGIKLQVQILRCLAEEPVTLLTSGYLDPIGSHRALLRNIAKRLRSQARRFERITNDGSPHPFPVLLRGAARAIDRYSGGSQTLVSQFPEELTLILSHTVALLAGPRTGAIPLRLAELIGAFDSDGRPDPELVVTSPRRLSRPVSRVFAIVDRTSSLAKALFSVLIFGVAITLLVLGRVSVTSIPGWKP